MNIIKSGINTFLSLLIGFSIFSMSTFLFYCQFFSNKKVESNNFFFILMFICLLFISFFIIYSDMTNKIEYGNESMIIKTLWIKRILYFTELKNIIHGHYPGSYWLNTKGSRHYFICLPFCKKKLLRMIEKIQNVNPEFENFLTVG